jgi:hypothetical protein
VCAKGCGEPGYEIICRWCHEPFLVCVKHWHGRRYCSKECGKQARREQKRKAQAKYLRKLKGKRRRAKASAAYRERKTKGLPSRGRRPRQKVIDQGGPPRSASEQHPRSRRCVVCGCLCRVIGQRN